MREKLLQLLEANLKAHTFTQREASVAAILEFFDAGAEQMDYERAHKIVLDEHERRFCLYLNRVAERRAEADSITISEIGEAITNAHIAFANSTKSLFDAHLDAS